MRHRNEWRDLVLPGLNASSTRRPRSPRRGGTCPARHPAVYPADTSQNGRTEQAPAFNRAGTDRVRRPGHPALLSESVNDPPTRTLPVPSAF